VKLIVLILTGILSFNSRAEGDFYSLRELVTKAESLQGKLSEKRDWLKSLDPARGWCIYNYPDGTCRDLDKSRIELWLKEVEASARCLQMIEDLPKATPLNKRVAEAWLNILRNDCAESEGSYPDQVPPSLDYEGKYRDAASNAVASISASLPALPYGPVNNSAEAGTLANQLTKCTKAFKWGYYVLNGPPKKPRYRLNASVMGKFATREDCEIARLKSSDANEGNWAAMTSAFTVTRINPLPSTLTFLKW